MNTNYDDEMLQQINENADLLGYVSQVMELEQRGKDYWGHCSLHTDKTASFSIKKKKNSYYCFSCRRSGGILGFLIDYEGMEFEEAVEKGARLANLDLSKMCQSKTITFLKKLRAISMKTDAEYEHKVFDESILQKYKSEPVQEWLDEGIKQEVMDLFGVRVDTWQNRIVYPVYDICGNLINIKARTRYPNFKQMKIPKYINYYEVGVMDYFQGLNITLPYILENKEVIVFESVKSVMKAYGWGYKNCVSAEKHTLTKEQIDLLVKLRVNVVFVFFSDVNYRNSDVKQDLDKLKRVTNVYIIEDKNKLLGGVETKNAPVDCGEEIWDELYSRKRKVV